MAHRLKRAVPWVVLGVLVVLRLLAATWIASYPDRALFPDSAGYLNLAAQIGEGGPYQSEVFPGMDFARPPAFPLFLAVLGWLGMAEPWMVTLVQLAMGVVVCLIIGLTVGRHWSPRAGWVGSLLYGALPNAVLWAMAILSDTLFTFLIALAAMAVLYFCETSRNRWVLVAGILVGLSALARPIGVALIPLWAVLLLALEWKRRVSWRRLLAPTLFCAAAAVFVVPWGVRNLDRYGMLAVSSIDVINLGEYQAPAALARAEGISLEEAHRQIPTSGVPQPGDRARYMAVIAAHPLDYLAVHAQGTWVLLTEAGQPNLAQLLNERYRSAGVLVALRQGDVRAAAASFLDTLRDPVLRWFLLVPWFAMAVQLVVYVLAVLGTIRLLRRRGGGRWAAAFLLTTCAVFLFVPGPVGNGRFRVPAEPFLCVLAGIGATAKRDGPPRQLAAPGI